MEQLCILVADDDADIVNAVRLYLEKDGLPSLPCILREQHHGEMGTLCQQ